MRARVVVCWLVLAATGCEDKSCATLFGNPNNKTGLSAQQCRPECAQCGAGFKPPVYGAAFTQSLIDDWRLASPFPALTTDPYAPPPPHDDAPGTVCGVLPQGAADARPRPYALVSYPSESAALAAGARPTHFGHCGVCSPLIDLAVYIRENDLTAPVRACAFASGDGGDPNLDCLLALGFDLPCAQLWNYNTAHTRASCLDICVANFTTPYNLPDGTLNPCLQCDEDQSGPIFKSVGGRTRRNSGLPNAICRPCSAVRPLIHHY